jgi:hypothetical protein
VVEGQVKEERLAGNGSVVWRGRGARVTFPEPEGGLNTNWSILSLNGCKNTITINNQHKNKKGGAVGKDLIR